MKELVTRNSTTAKDFKDTVRENQEWKVECVEVEKNNIFRSLFSQVYKTQELYMKLRKLCVKYMRLHKIRFELFMKKNVSRKR